MTAYAGYFKFQNMTGQKITKGNCAHWTTDYGKKTITLDGLPDGGSSDSTDFKTSSSNKDRWSFDITLADGNNYHCAEHDCGFESEDNGKTVILQVVIAGRDHVFHIIMPASSSCETGF